MDAEADSIEARRGAENFLAAIVEQAVEDAHLVGQLFRRAEHENEGRISCSLEVLTRLGVILRQAEWERHSICAHHAAELGSASQNWLTLLEEMEAGSLHPKAEALIGGMIGVLGEKVLWDSDNSEMRLQVGIESSLDDEAVGALAAFLIENTLEPKQ